MRKADRSKTGIVFNIQKFSVNDGPGIRTAVFLKGCPLHCRWCSNPESQYARPQILHDRKKCIKCLHCTQVCPTGSIYYESDHISMNPSLCTMCMKCIDECPAEALEEEGSIMSVQKVMDTVLQDKVFYEESGGGITLTGGEMLSQPDFACELYLASKEEGLNTCCETSGFASEDIFARVIENVDFILIDVKHWNPEQHMKGTGISNSLPYANLKYAISSGKHVLPRIPVIPQFNDSLDDAAELARMIKNAGGQECQILPFHQFGENKYSLLEHSYAYSNTPALHKEELERYRQQFEENGIRAFF